MTIATGDVIRVTAGLKFQTSHDVQNVFHCDCVNDNSASQTDLRDDLADYLETVYDSLISGFIDDTTFDGIDIFNVTQDNPEPSVAWPTLTVGGSSGESLPEGVAALVLGRTAVSKVQGKKYFGVYDESAITDGVWNSGALTNLGLAAADYITPFTGGSGATWDPGVFSRATMAFTPFSEASVNNVAAYQRRRKRGVGS